MTAPARRCWSGREFQTKTTSSFAVFQLGLLACCRFVQLNSISFCFPSAKACSSISVQFTVKEFPLNSRCWASKGSKVFPSLDNCSRFRSFATPSFHSTLRCACFQLVVQFSTPFIFIVPSKCSRTKLATQLWGRDEIILIHYRSVECERGEKSSERLIARAI